MATLTRRDGVTQADFEAALERFKADPTPENEAAATKAFEAITGHRATCPDCIIKRTQFVSGLSKIRQGDVVYGAASVARAVRGAVAVNLRKIFGL